MHTKPKIHKAKWRKVPLTAGRLLECSFPGCDKTKQPSGPGGIA